MSFTRTILLLWFISSVFGHGFIHNVIIQGKTYPGWNPFSDPYLSPVSDKIVRKVRDDGFVADGDVDMACHHGGLVGTSETADIDAGSPIVFQWIYWPSDHQGPVSTYMTSCNGDCHSFNPHEAKWFKLDAAGYFPEDRQWAADRLRADDNSWTSTIPVDLTPGQYLVRHEIIALHSGAPQFYPSCVQVNVKGEGNGVPMDTDLATFPEIYQGITWPNIYGDFGGTFSIPGPAPVRLGARSGDSTPVSTTTPSPRGSTASTSGMVTPNKTSSKTSSETSSETGRCVLLRAGDPGSRKM